MLYLLTSALQQTLLFLPLVFAVYLSYQILSITDLTVEGSFVLGACVFSRLMVAGYTQMISLLFALLAGMLVGIFVCILQKISKINSLLAGILAVFMLYSVNFSILGKPNTSLLNIPLSLSALQNNHPQLFWVALIVLTICMSSLLIFLLHSRYGLLLRAYGANKKLLATLGKNPTLYLALGLSLSNLLAALCGVIAAQINGYADIQMGTGMALTAIGSVVIGSKIMECFFDAQKFSAIKGLFGSLFGAYLYFLVLNGFLALDINPIYIKLCLGLLLVLFLSTASLKTTRGHHHELFTT